MDPNVIWEDLYAALRVMDRQQACDQAAALLLWLDAGGYPPRLVEPEEMAEPSRSKIVREFCLGVLQRSGGPP
jgi:hypothetical protein